MTKAQIIDQVYLAVNGGRPTSDSDVQRADIGSMLPAAIAMSRKQQQGEDLLFAMREKRLTGLVSRPVYNSGSEVKLPVSEEDGLGVIELPSSPSPSPLAQPYVRPTQGPGGYVQAGNRPELMGVPESCGLVFWWLDGKKIYLQGLGFPVCDHIVKIELDVNGLPDDFELAIGGEAEARAIEMLVNFFMVQKGTAKDFRINRNDDATTDSNDQRR